MNIKQFLVLKACDKLPSDIRYIIWKNVKDDAANAIRNIYLLKVKRNVDIFNELMFIYNSLRSSWRTKLPFQWQVILSKKILKNKVKKYFINIRNKITYKYIQEPAIWIDYIENICELYSINGEWFTYNVGPIIDKIKNSNEIYMNTGIAYWNNL